MSGGHFNYKQYELGYIADEIEELVIKNGSDEKNEWGDTKHSNFTPETIDNFKKAVTILREAQIYVQRIDWLVSGDDGEDSFHSRLAHDLERLKDGTS